MLVPLLINAAAALAGKLLLAAKDCLFRKSTKARRDGYFGKIIVQQISTKRRCKKDDGLSIGRDLATVPYQDQISRSPGALRGITSPGGVLSQ